MSRKHRQFKQSALTMLLASVVFCARAPATVAQMPANLELEPIELQADRISEDGQEVGREEGRFGGQRLEMQPDQNGSISRNLIRAPSVSFRKWGNDEGSQLLSLRGQDPAQTRLYLNSFPLGDGAGSGLDTRWVQPRWMSHALILPHGDPLTLMHESLGGAVDMRTAFGEGRSTSADVGVVAGSFGTRGLNARLHQETFGLDFDSRQATDDFSFRDSSGTLWDASDDSVSRRQNNEWGRVSFLPWYSARLGSSRLKLFGLGGWERRHLPGIDGSLKSSDWREQLQLLGGAWQSAGGSVVRVYGRHRENSVTNRGVGSSGLAALPGKSNETAAGISVGSEARWTSATRLRAVLGIDRENLSNEVALSGVSRIEGTKDSLVGVLSLETPWLVEHSLLMPVEVNTFTPFEGMVGYEGRPATRYVLPSPRWSTLSTINGELAVHTVIGFFQKSPGLYDLYGDARGLLPNPTLAPERAWKAEAGVQWPLRVWTGRLQITATSAWSDNRDLLTRTSIGPGTSMSQNIGRSRIFSQEFSAMWTLPSGWRWQWVSQMLLSSNLSPIPYYSGKELPYRSRWRWNLDVEKQWGSFSCGYLWQWQSGFFADPLNVNRVAPFQEHSLRARYRHRELGEITAEVANLFDVTTVGAQVLGRALQMSPSGMMGYPYPGRRAYLTWNYAW